MMDGKRVRVVIVGGSLSGLFAALALKKSGHSVRILERYQKDELRDQGAGLVMRPDVQAFLSTYVSHSSEVYSLLCKELIVVDTNGRILQRSPVNFKYTSWGLIHRCLMESFEDLIKESQNSSYEYGCAVEKVEEQGDIVLVSYMKNGQQLTVEADLVIGADGASSRVRECLLPHIQRTYAGYVIWRGLVGENDLSEAGRDMFTDNGSFHWGEDFLILCYPIPGETTNLEAGKRLANWGWYQNLTKSDFGDLMNDVDGKRHRFTMPMGKMKPELVEKQYAHAKKTLPPQFVELITKTALPFVQVVTDVLSPQNMFFGGKVVLIGDAAAGARPHVGAGTSQALFHVLTLERFLDGEITAKQWSEDALKFSLMLYEAGLELGRIAMSKEVQLPEASVMFVKTLRGLDREMAEMTEKAKLGKDSKLKT